MSDPQHRPADLSEVALFPLPNVVLFPRAILPLHIFEERYKEMTRDVLTGTRQIAMALLKPQWEKAYYQRPAVEAFVCVGTVVSHEQLPDGRYNFLLQGHTRARIVREFGDKTYRLAELEKASETLHEASELDEERHRLAKVFEEGSLLATDIGRQFRQLLDTPFPTADIADLIAFRLLDDILLKHTLLSNCDVKDRVRRIVRALEASWPSGPLPMPHRPVKPSLN